MSVKRPTYSQDVWEKWIEEIEMEEAEKQRYSRLHPTPKHPKRKNYPTK